MTPFAPADPACTPPRIAIIEPNRAKGALLAYFLANSGGFSVVAVETSGAGGIAGIAETKPDVVLAALTPAGFSPGDFIRQIREAAPFAKLVLLATECNECLIQAVASAGYHGLVYEPDEDLVTLSQAIASARRGIRFTSTRFVQGQLNLRGQPRAFSKILSPREQEVLSCVAQSLSDDEIAAQLGCSRNTVLSHRRNLMHKLQIHSLPKLIRYCADKGFTLNPPFFPSPAIRKPKLS